MIASRRRALLALLVPLALVLTGLTPASGTASGDLPRPESIIGYWSVAGGIVHIEQLNADHYSTNAVEPIGFYDTGVEKCIFEQPGESVFGELIGSGYQFVGSVDYADPDGCKEVGTDTQATFTLEQDGQSIQICSKDPTSTYAFTDCHSMYRVERDVTLTVLGDSYSSGEGAPPYYGGGCHRSKLAWAEQMARKTEELQGVDMLACSGALAKNVYRDSFKGQQPQLDEFNPDSDLVTLTIGGNDTGFSRILKRCLVTNCIQLGTVKDARNFVANYMGARLSHVYAGVQAKLAPGATFAVVGYPRLFPESNREEDCAWLTNGERVGLNALGKQLNRVIEKESTRYGAQYIDVTDAADGHELCTENTSWFFGVTRASNAVQQNGHPLAPGQAAIAKVVGRQLGLTTD